MKDILWISSYAPYDKVGHAGGKTHNYYLKFLCRENVNIHLITICHERELNKIDYDQYKINYDLIIRKQCLPAKIERKISSLNAKYNVFHKYAGKLFGYQKRPLKKRIKKLAQKGYNPEIIILEWTETILLLPYIKKYFPQSKTIVIEEDVSFLSYYRIWKTEKNLIKKVISEKKYEKLKRIELEALRRSDRILVTNQKDLRILQQENIENDKMDVICPYYDNMVSTEYMRKTNRIIFFGAMDRPENYLSAIWFIEKVMPLLKDTDITFEVIGSNPPRNLQSFEKENIHIRGFVEDISLYFKDSLCLAAPLVLGAGIKVKILEALSAGIPVLTNEIGIEGIDAIDKRDYFYCSEPQEYADIIMKLYSGKIDYALISKNAKNFIQNNFDLENSAQRFKRIVENLL